jgi:predicted phage terminase large subunit-like protein
MSEQSIFASLADALEGDWHHQARPAQIIPPGDWRVWLILAGRGWGKTRTGSEFIRSEVKAGCGRIALVGATAADVRDIMIEGESGILATSPNYDRPTYEPSKRRLSWLSGATATAYSADEPERLRGPQSDCAWCDELATWRYPDAWHQLRFGLRLGRNPRVLATTTPRPVKLIRDLIKREGQDVFVTRGVTTENAANLPESYLAEMQARYGGTRLGRQELMAEILEDVPGALWQREWIERDRVDKAPDMRRIVVAIDPAASSGEDADETGIVVCGVGTDGRGYVLEDLSGRYAPHEWARHAIMAYHRHRADRIIAEKNNGGEMVENTIRMIDPNVAYRAVHASRGKVTRAEPVAALYEQRRISHVGSHPQLEDQQCNFSSDFDRSRSGSPDRLDAMVWAFTDLIVESAPGYGIIEYYRREVEKENARSDPNDASQFTVTLLAPTGISHVNLMSGRIVLVPPDRLVAMTVQDSKPLLAFGWTTNNSEIAK